MTPSTTGSDANRISSNRIISKVLIANRGEIAVRIARACRDAVHVVTADEAYSLAGDTPGD